MAYLAMRSRGGGCLNLIWALLVIVYQDGFEKTIVGVLHMFWRGDSDIVLIECSGHCLCTLEQLGQNSTEKEKR